MFSQTHLCLQATGEFYMRQHTQHDEVMFVPVQGNSFASMQRTVPHCMKRQAIESCMLVGNLPWQTGTA